jgi:hypothetical protein
MAPVTIKLKAVLKKYETEVQPAVVRVVPNGYG